MRRIFGALLAGVSAGIGAWFAMHTLRFAILTFLLFAVAFYLFRPRFNRK